MFQFEEVSIKAALYLLDKAELLETARSNPVLVVRTMSQMVRPDCACIGMSHGSYGCLSFSPTRTTRTAEC